MIHPVRILMISFYGSGLSNPDVQLSGAMARQRDYASRVELYHTIVPAAGTSEAPIEVEENLVVHPVVARNPVQFFWRAYRRAQRLQHEYGYTVLMVDNPHIGGVLGAWLKVRLRLPLVVHAMGDMIRNPWYSAERLSNRFKDILTEVAVRAADVIRVSTAAEVERLASASFAAKVQRVSFYVDHAALREQLAQQSTEKATVPTALYVGRLGGQKDLTTLLDAWMQVIEQLPAAQLLIVGGGPDAAKLQAHAELRGITRSVTFTGPVPYEQVMQYFAQSHVFVMSSLFEGTCMVLHEAGLAGVPVVSTAFAGALDLITDGETGYVVPIRDSAALGDRVATVLQDDARAARMGQALQRAVQHFDRDYALSEWDALCRRLTTTVAR